MGYSINNSPRLGLELLQIRIMGVVKDIVKLNIVSSRGVSNSIIYY